MDKKTKSHRSRLGSQTKTNDQYSSSKKIKRSHSSDSSSSSSNDSSTKHKRRHKNKSRSKSPSRHRSRKKPHKHRRSRSRSHERMLNPGEMEILKERKKREKEMAKALETPEEKRARRLAKKEIKERKRKTQMGWDEEYLGYSNMDNPFGDEHLLDTFHWNKKLEKAGIRDAPKEDIEKLQKQKMIENKMELEKVKKRRLEREHEREERDNEREMLQRQKEAEYYREWEEQEDNFHLNQAKMRSKIRIDDGRAKPIDLLAKYVDAESDDFAVEMHEPYTYLNGLTITDLEDLIEDIKVYMELEQGQNVDYWRDITIICEEELSKLRKLDPNNLDFIGERRSGINTSVTEDVNSVFKGKSLAQLGLLGEQIKGKLKGGEGIDVGYWESLLQQLKAHMARTRLRERHQEQLRRKLFKLKQEQGIESEPLFPIMQQTSPETHQSDKEDSPKEGEEQPSTSGQGAIKEVKEQEQVKEEPEESVLTEEDLHRQSYIDYDSGAYSPKLIQYKDLEPDTLIYDPEDDMKRLEFARQQLKQTGQAKKDSDTELIKRAKEGMNAEEAQFSVQLHLGEQKLLWSDKYRPRKPRFFNRVHTGFEWNKYNQTHYDIDNPPPKIVQGYKFNIFYPDLIDKANTPEYVLTPLDDNKDFGMLRFKAGPPYEDIAFKIVNREWEYSYKRGFRCQFYNNIFQLWFHFKRYRYRR